MALFDAIKHMSTKARKISVAEDKRQVGSVSSFIETHSSC